MSSKLPRAKSGGGASLGRERGLFTTSLPDSIISAELRVFGDTNRGSATTCAQEISGVVNGYPGVGDGLYHPVMRMPGSGASIMITDSGMLMGEVLQSSRRPDGSPGGKITSLLWALHHQNATLYLPRHILDEVERDLPRRARPTDDIDLARRRLRTLYLSHARIIDVPPGWAIKDPRVRTLAGRHPADLPAAQLAVTIGECFLLSEDRDLTDIPQLGFSAWLEVTHASANETEIEAIYVTASIPFNAAEAAAGAAYRRIAAASTGGKWALAGLAAIMVIGGIWWVKSGRAGKFFEAARPVIKELGQTYGPPLMETLERHTQGQVAFARAVVPRAAAQTLGERIARLLAHAREPLLAVDIARELETPGNLRNRTQLVRAELRDCKAFTEVSKGRWELGRPSGYEAAQLPVDEVVDYRDRVHKNTRRAWPRDGHADSRASKTA
jgi:predicted nucleic acid-binding protein